MKRVVLFLMAATLAAAAQQGKSPNTIADKAQLPNYSDLHCAGFLRQNPLPYTNSVIAGEHAPHTTRYAEGETIFLQGAGLQEGSVVSLVRELKDPNRNEAYSGQTGDINRTGQPYADLGRARVFAMRQGVAVANVEFSCGPIVPGDLAIAYEERTMPSAAGNVTLDRFPTEPTGATGRIILAKDFDTVLGTGQKMYLDLGSNQVRPGDTFRIVRGYGPDEMVAIERLSYNASISEDTQRRKMKLRKGELKALPRRTLGQGIVLLTTEGSSTGMITFALEDVQVGDRVEIVPAGSASTR